MTTINLKDFYPWYTHDEYIEVSDEVAKEFIASKRREAAHAERVRYNKAFYSLDAGDGIEQTALFQAMSPCEIYERKMTLEQLYAAMDALPDKQGRRLYAHYILGVPQTEIARAEGVGLTAVNNSIERGLRNMEKMLKNIR